MLQNFSKLGKLVCGTLLIEAHVLSTVLAATFPLPSGKFNTTITTAQVTDHSRLDPYAPSRQPRTLMISVFEPSICVASETPYMDPLTAAWADSQFAVFRIPPGTFGSLNLLTCPPNANPKHHSRVRKEKYPLVLFSPGLGNPRLFYSALAQEVASAGYTVITIDHPYDAGIVVFSDNSSILAGNISTDAQIWQDVDVRVKDVSFILDTLSRPSIPPSPIPGLGCVPGTSRVAIFGHSLGGATAASSIRADNRLVAGVNLDGTFFGPVINSGLPKPFMIFAHEGKNTSTDPSWGTIWPRLTGFKRLLELEGSTHGTFTDLRDVVDVLGLGENLPPQAAELLGSLNGERAIDVIGKYVAAFFDFTLKGKKSPLLDGPSKSFPEVVFEYPDK